MKAALRLLVATVAIAPLGFVAACGGGDEAAEGPRFLVAVAPNPAQLTSEASAIRIIELDTKESRQVGEAAFYTELKFSPDGRYLAALGGDTAGSAAWVAVFDAATGEETASDREAGAIAGMAWAPDGSRLAVIHEAAVVLLEPAGSYTVDEGVGLPAGVNPLRWAWTPDGEVFGVITEGQLVLVPVSSSETGAEIARSDFPGDSENWAVRGGEEPREIGLVDLRPVGGIPEGRAEYPIHLPGDGTIEDGEPRVVSIYDWNTLPSPEFDAATDRQFAAIRKSCSPCRTADGSGSLFVVWVAKGVLAPPGEGEEWPDGTQTLLAIEVSASEATALDLGIGPQGPIDVSAWQPVYDVARLAE
jgi:hypothetical protein